MTRGTQLQTKQKAGLIVGALIIGGVLIVGFGGFGLAQIPQILIDQYVTDNTNTSDPARQLSGYLDYDMTVRFNDGTSQHYARNVQFNKVTFSLAELAFYTNSSKTKQIVGVDIFAGTEFKMPTNRTGIDNAVSYNGLLSVYLNDTLVTVQNHTKSFTLDQLNTPQPLYTYTIVPSQLPSSGLSTNQFYVLSFKASDNFNFIVNGSPKVLTVNSQPTLYYQNLQPFYGVISTTTLGVSLDRVPKYDSTGSVSTYWSYLVVTAKGFKANSPLTFDYNRPACGAYCDMSKFTDTNHDKTITSDASGSAQDRTLVYTGFSMPKPWYYFAYLTVSDGTHTVGPLKIGSTGDTDKNPGIIL